jgi:sugar phosphate isomerase/epimerase
VLDFIDEVGSSALRACLDAPLMEEHSEDYYREAIAAAGQRFAFSHYGGRFVRDKQGEVIRNLRKPIPYKSDDRAFVKAAKELVNYQGHWGYELCTPILTGHRYEGLKYALDQVQLASEFMRRIIDSV